MSGTVASVDQGTYHSHVNFAKSANLLRQLPNGAEHGVLRRRSGRNLAAGNGGGDAGEETDASLIEFFEVLEKGQPRPRTRIGNSLKERRPRHHSHHHL